MHDWLIQSSADAGDKTRLYKFDDIGCAVIWLHQQPWQYDTRTEIWVKDRRNGEWVDARIAFYITGRISPMNYGLGAQAQHTDAALDYTRAVAHIIEVEQEQHQHGGYRRAEQQ